MLHIEKYITYNIFGGGWGHGGADSRACTDEVPDGRNRV